MVSEEKELLREIITSDDFIKKSVKLTKCVSKAISEGTKLERKRTLRIIDNFRRKQKRKQKKSDLFHGGKVFYNPLDDKLKELRKIIKQCTSKQ